ncbi:MAG: c-type cytochrome [Ilumatobacteraceae bacterium]
MSVLLLAFAAACGSDGSDLSEAGERGRKVSNSNGCAACHGPKGEGGSGPAWVGLYNAEVELRDGTFVIADEDYLVRAIVEPEADLRAGYTLQMPRNGLSESEVADVIAYIEELSQDG